MNGRETIPDRYCKRKARLSAMHCSWVDELFLIVGFGKNEGFEKDTPEKSSEMVYKLHSACPYGGVYLLSIRPFLLWQSRKYKGFC